MYKLDINISRGKKKKKKKKTLCKLSQGFCGKIATCVYTHGTRYLLSDTVSTRLTELCGKLLPYLYIYIAMVTTHTYGTMRDIHLYGYHTE